MKMRLYLKKSNLTFHLSGIKIGSKDGYKRKNKLVDGKVIFERV